MNHITDLLIQLVTVVFVFTLIFTGLLGIFALIFVVQQARLAYDAHRQQRASRDYYQQLHASILRHIDSLLSQMEGSK